MSTASDSSVAWFSRGKSLPLGFFAAPSCEVSSAVEDVLLVGVLAATDMNRGAGCRHERLPSGPNVAQIQISVRPHATRSSVAES